MKRSWMNCLRRAKKSRPGISGLDRLEVSETEVSQAPAFKPKKSVALSGTPAGNTALCTVGHTGNDLHYRGYDIKDLAAHCEYEEVAHLLVHGKLPTAAELAAYKASLKPLRSLACGGEAGAGTAAASTHPMDVLRTGVSVLGCIEPKARRTTTRARARLPTGCSLRSHRCCSIGTTTRATESASKSKPTTTPSPRIFFICCTARPSAEWTRAMQTSLILYAEHEFNASTFTARVIAGTGSDLYSCIYRSHWRAQRPQARRSQRSCAGDSTALQRSRRSRDRHSPPRSQREVIIGFGHPVYTISDPRSDIVKEVARELAVAAGDTLLYSVAERIESVMRTPSACSPTSTGTPPWPIIRWEFPSTCLRRCLSLRALPAGRRT
jgi:2-methylcitrate synthase